MNKAYFLVQCHCELHNDQCIVNAVKDSIDILYNQNTLRSVFYELECIYKNEFICHRQKKIIQEYLKYNRMIRWLAFKFIYKMKVRLLNISGPQNSYDVDGATPLSEVRHTVSLFQHGKWWRFGCVQLNKYIYSQLSNICEETHKPRPLNPVNIWTNCKFDHSHYACIEYACTKNGIRMPHVFRLFQSENYDIRHFKRTYNKYLHKQFTYPKYIRSVNTMDDIAHIIHRIAEDSNHPDSAYTLLRQLRDVPFDIVQRETIKLLDNPKHQIDVNGKIIYSNHVFMDVPAHSIKGDNIGYEKPLPQLDWNKNKRNMDISHTA